MNQHLPHIVLVGLPGSGKSVVGLELARRLHRPFLDANTSSNVPTDHYLDEPEDSTAVADAGRKWFENAIDHHGPTVIAAPATLLADHVVIDRKRVWVAWLDSPVEVLTERIVADSPDVAEEDVAAHFSGREAEQRERAHALPVARVDVSEPRQAADQLVLEYSKQHGNP